MNFPFFSVQPGHDLAYNEIVKPGRRWAFSYYFLYRWLPLLHPQQAMLIQVLRQSTWQKGQPTGRCQLANATLCRLMGWSESSHKTLLTELERPLTDWFITRERTRKRHVTEGHAVEGAPHYRLAMDDPLTPRDQAALRSLLASHSPESPYAAAELLAELASRHTRELWALLDEQPVPATLPTHPATVGQIAGAAWPHLQAGKSEGSRPLAEAAERCQLRLTGAGYAHMELDYLLRGWLPEIGIANSWLVIALRARCFHDPQTGETRDVVTIGRKELEEQLGIPSRTFRRMLRDEATQLLFHISPAGEPADPATPRNLPHRGHLAFHVAYPLLPVAPADRERYERLLMGEKESRDEATFSTSGQRTRLEAANQPGWSSEDFHKRPANPARSGQPTRLIEVKAASEPGSKRPTNPADRGESGQRTRLEVANQPTIQSSRKYKDLNTEKEVLPPKTFGRGEEKEEEAEIRKLLEPFRIQGLSRLLQQPDLTAALVRGWIYKGYEEVDAVQMPGYLFRRLYRGPQDGSRESLPELYLRAGEVDDDEAGQFEEWWLEEWAPPPFEDGTQRARYSAWLQVVKREVGDPDRPDFSPHARWRREMARARSLSC